jgi:tRNA threonylcarbamoyladenosine biosynthesis protein TsaE
MEIIYSLNEIDTVSEQIINHIKNKVVLFDAEMGAGKTTLIKAILKHLGVNDATSSPTFSIVNEYRLENNSPLYHFDLYRLNSEEEAYDFGIEEYLYADAWCFIEWPEKAPNLLPKDHNKILINILPNGKRKLTLI